MPTQYRFPLHPAGAKEVNEVLALHGARGQVAFSAAGVPFSPHAADAPVGRRFAAVQLVELGLAEQTELAPALGLHRATIHRCRRKVQAAGVLGLVEARPGPKGRHKLTGPRLQEAQAQLDAGASLRAAAAAVGVREGTLRHALGRGDLRRPAAAPAAPPAAPPAPAPAGPRQRSDQDAASPGGIAVQRQAERALAATGRLAEAPPRFAAAEAVQGAGVLCALPALLQHGLLAVGEHVYGRLRNGFYGLRSVLLTLAVLALLRVRTSEQLQGHAPHRGLAERWIAQAPDAIGFLYIDGHVRPYHGHAHRLPEAHVARRRLCLPATTHFYVNDQAAAPVFLVTAPANDGLVRMLRTEVLPELRRQLGPDRRATVVFDREGWSPALFAELLAAGFDLLTYRKGKTRAWPARAFAEVTGVVAGRKVTYTLAAKGVRLKNGLRLREVRRLTATGHQTAVLTNRTDLP